MDRAGVTAAVMEVYTIGEFMDFIISAKLETTADGKNYYK